MRRRLALFLLVVLSGCGPRTEPAGEPAVVELPSPAGAGAMAPALAVDGSDLLMSWLEPGPSGGHRLLFARWRDGAWGPTTEIAAGSDFFANWADVPKVGVGGDGTLWAHWLAKLGEDTYAYGIFLARSLDGGLTWEPQGTLHEDLTPSEHGFVAFAAEGDGLRATWLDGREMPAGEPMTLRTALLGDHVGPSRILDERVCECCPTDLVTTPSGPLVVYRDRSTTEVRNIAFTRGLGDSWTEPQALHADDWQIAGCPVNGPAAAVDGDEVAVAWFTAPAGEARVQLIRSHDAGATFGSPVVVDGDRPLGRVDVAIDAAGMPWVSWLAVDGAIARLRVAGIEGDARGRELELAVTSASRASGVPRLERLGDGLVAVWVETEEDRPSTLRLARWR